MIKVYDRINNSYEEELVAGKGYLEWIYGSPVGKNITNLIIKKRLFSKMYGVFCDTKLSSTRIDAFTKKFNIDMTITQKKINEFTSFNDFFTRKLNPKYRPINNNKNILISPGDGRLLAHKNIDLDNIIQVKGLTYSLRELINNDTTAKNYKNGTCIILRLAPTDYHRFHFVDSGIPSESHFIKGNYYSVNPVALKTIPKLFCENKREWSIFKSDNFNDILYIEIGATCVGSILQTYKANTIINKGDEKGYFKFGGSTVILFFKENCISIDDDILEQSKLGFECKVKLGEKIGIKLQ
ncbi:phosphatidylserine decarboxylase [Clostridium felsineum]|uniref:Phosphatidylserine decarboxylase proenzyme n=1 Tax=Clostridium felsineum TaxID=36839 RepID=A0A1S8LMB1_9CLOT|nr:phosphatidylserine decarboxylase [Clostridium felsineum]URZ05189.1 Phosphatidylserine decarboxylase proenzyme [Clostridium felsineum]URZ10230.1 Phosphatidylserine decarboxylase proenzyme [Clostridium felsineum]